MSRITIAKLLIIIIPNLLLAFTVQARPEYLAIYAADPYSRPELRDKCSVCHIPPPAQPYTDITLNRVHDPAETGMDPAYAQRTTVKKYRTTPLRALWQHPPYFHDGRAATLGDVVGHYDRVLRLRLTAGQKRDLVEFLKSI